jgi:hypothetical protein
MSCGTLCATWLPSSSTGISGGWLARRRSAGASSDGSLPGGAADPDETHSAFDYLDWSAVVAAIPEDVAALGRGGEQLDAHALDGRLAAVLRAQRCIDWQLGRLLRLFFDLRLPQLMGFSSASRYVRERLGISTRKARALVAVERKTWDAPAFAEAYRNGELSWLRALTILPVLSERGAAAWTARATAVTVRRLAAEVDWALDTADAHEMPYGSLAPPPAGSALPRPERQMRARGDGPRLDGEIRFAAPASVAALLQRALAAFAGPADPRWLALEKLLLHVWSEWQRQPRHRDPVFTRDGWRCAVPACSSRKHLHDHHLRFRSRGGDNDRGNRITVCAWHHLRGIHAGRVRARGIAPDAILWEIGVRSGRPPLLRLLADRYVP